MRNEGKCSGCTPPKLPASGDAGYSLGCAVADYAQRYAVDHDAVPDRFESVDRAFLEATARLTRNYIQLEELAGKLFGYTYQSPPTACATDRVGNNVQPPVVERLNNSVESLQHANYRLEELISAFQQ